MVYKKSPASEQITEYRKKKYEVWDLLDKRRRKVGSIRELSSTMKMIAYSLQILQLKYNV